MIGLAALYITKKPKNDYGTEQIKRYAYYAIIISSNENSSSVLKKSTEVYTKVFKEDTIESSYAEACKAFDRIRQWEHVQLMISSKQSKMNRNNLLILVREENDIIVEETVIDRINNFSLNF